MSDLSALIDDLRDIRVKLVRRSARLVSVMLIVVSAVAFVEQVGLLMNNGFLLVWAPMLVEVIMFVLSIGLMRKYTFLSRFMSLIDARYRGRLRRGFFIYVGELAAYFAIGYLLSRASLSMALAFEVSFLPVLLRLPAEEVRSKADKLFIIYLASSPSYFLVPEWGLSIAGALLLMGGIYVARR
ncbi:hypothetical protein GCM10007981_01120 [Thermocladium modestius]|uniref:Uncharacterized protein n=1 Tax=Thermocladium modestius TaxID=62609 RepID=A0A830GQU9_9CREN|nr:hypothetical protein [Thermocladium modestius]GGP19041.1 hypothetical protein GCM10007981_01120 [Thermocladium modestius]